MKSLPQSPESRAQAAPTARPRRALGLAGALLAVLLFVAPPALAAPKGVKRVGDLAAKTADLLVVRPISLGYLALGAVGFVAGTVWMYSLRTVPTASILNEPETGYRDEMLDNFVRIPGEFVFQRELGDFSNGLGPG